MPVDPQIKRSKDTYVCLQTVDDFLYFTYKTIEALLVNDILIKAGWRNYESPPITIALISATLFFQAMFEVPAGSVADAFGRRLAVTLSLLLRASACGILTILLLFSQITASRVAIIGGIIFLQLCLASSEALLSNSLEAWIVDTLHTVNATQDEIDRMFSRSRIPRNFAIVLSAPLAFFVDYFRPNSFGSKSVGFFTLILLLLCFVGAATYALHRIAEPYRFISDRPRARQQQTFTFFWHIWRRFKNTWENALSHFRDIPSFPWVICVAASPYSAWVTISWFWPLICRKALQENMGFSVDRAGKALAFVGVVIGLGRVCGAYLFNEVFARGDDSASRIDRLYFRAVFVNLILAGIGGLVLATAHITIAVFACFVLALVLAKGAEEAVKAAKDVAVHRRIPTPDERATLASCVDAVVSIIGFLAIIVCVLAVYVYGQTNDTAFGATLLCSVAAVGGGVLLVAALRLSAKPQVR